MAEYTIAEPSQLRASVGTKAAELVGHIDVIEGNLQVDLFDLRRTRGTIRADVASISMTDTTRGEISWVSAVAQALIKSRTGDEVRLLTPTGWETIEVLDVRYPAP